MRRTSLGRLYSGMAFRMARDLGLHVDPKKLGPLSSQFSWTEDLALRQQMFWSCCTWDKTSESVSGGAPRLCWKPSSCPLPTLSLDGRDADDEIWQPVLVQDLYPRGVVRHRTLTYEICCVLVSFAR